MINLTKNKIIEILIEENEKLKIKFDVKKIGLFGSYVHDKQTIESDLDILVDFADPTFDKYMDLKFYLEELFQKNVDLVLYENIKPRLKQYILSEVHFAQGL